MTIDEMLARECIRCTMMNYTIAGDRLHGDDFIAVFTEDAVLESDGVPAQDAFRFEGRGAIREWIARWRPGAGEAATHGARFVRHHLSTSQIKFTNRATASARTYWVAYTDVGADHCGMYVDVLRKCDDQWLIAHRKVRLDWRSPHSLFKSAIARTAERGAE